MRYFSGGCFLCSAKTIDSEEKRHYVCNLKTPNGALPPAARTVHFDVFLLSTSALG